MKEFMKTMQAVLDNDSVYNFTKNCVLSKYNSGLYQNIKKIVLKRKDCSIVELDVLVKVDDTELKVYVNGWECPIVRLGQFCKPHIQSADILEAYEKSLQAEVAGITQKVSDCSFGSSWENTKEGIYCEYSKTEVEPGEEVCYAYSIKKKKRLGLIMTKYKSVVCESDFS